ncbi:hypothetical protein GGX14DRAFT_407962 [Mycena pura]|uniref:Uncharacterized protein n=1 Tax=Mycena pura TaxID=153505 RepID=A0AAD6UMK5_9AGAR|nr:hypothetical protein GGX14DRAFT_407962 [Mycena pura]
MSIRFLPSIWSNFQEIWCSGSLARKIIDHPTIDRQSAAGGEHQQNPGTRLASMSNARRDACVGRYDKLKGGGCRATGATQCIRVADIAGRGGVRWGASAGSRRGPEYRGAGVGGGWRMTGLGNACGAQHNGKHYCVPILREYVPVVPACTMCCSVGESGGGNWDLDNTDAASLARRGRRAQRAAGVGPTVLGLQAHAACGEQRVRHVGGVGEGSRGRVASSTLRDPSEKRRAAICSQRARKNGRRKAVRYVNGGEAGSESCGRVQWVAGGDGKRVGGSVHDSNARGGEGGAGEAVVGYIDDK